ncbi:MULTISPECIES: DUF2076 domain-containing protein [Herbaspirillum]|uniref:DUF2076 domain-containing protein n=1 Tax=Herbaspirillum huttiense subsp. lycopersici TaxID=3074428 RepID=A0ABU2ENM9_9BURK|nr:MULTISPECIES: DUF2076 domain-containing protein [Herbaspirillum]MBP1315466.1 hypothetical protein [Herbaspirillum sp. 1130]MDR6741298.1 hypothetical protein [Herbaspirillum sp. 1173]MDR9849432.1 DUF2076 domain-containing protein [Herbaspirillum huttiense SE1]
MSPQETQALQDFLQQLTQVQGISKDAQADAMIQAAVARQPDAAYLLVQRALLMEQALNATKAQVAALQNQVQSLQANAAGGARSSGFLDGNAWGNAPAAASARPQPAVPAYMPAPAQPYPAPQQAVPAYQAAPAAAPSSGFFGGGMGSMLGTVAATAAGVAGGAFLYQGIEHLFNGNSGSGLAHQNGLSAPVENIENTTVNNYYGSDGDRKSDFASNDSGSDSGSSSDLADLSNFDVDDGGGYDDTLV